jgi:hypothetical protein
VRIDKVRDKVFEVIDKPAARGAGTNKGVTFSYGYRGLAQIYIFYHKERRELREKRRIPDSPKKAFRS